MKKSQKEQLKKSAEATRAIYQVFMAQPQWMTHVSKERFIEFLKNAIESEEAIYQQFMDSQERLRKLYKKTGDMDNLVEGSKCLTTAIERDQAMNTARTLLKLFEGRDFLYRAPDQVHFDFSSYCREN